MQGPLTFSPKNPGRYAVSVAGLPPTGYPDLTANMLVEVYLGGHWIQGNIQYGNVYAAPLDESIGGYYFAARDGSVVGLCTGMHVRIP